jgi:hypothetical protein
MRGFPFRRWLNVILPCLAVLLIIALVLPAVQKAREAARKTQSKNNLHQLMLAMHNYHDVYERFPPGAIVDAEGIAYRGWTTAILPYLDSSPVYNQIDMNVPWDEQANEFLHRSDYPIYRSPSESEVTTAEGYPLSHYEANPHLFHRNNSVSIDDMSAGTGDTWALGEAAGHFLPWGYPFHWRPLGARLNDGPDSYGRSTADGALIAFADGVIRFIPNEIDPAVFKQMADAPPVPTAEATALPPRPMHFRSSGRIRETGVFGDDSTYQAIKDPKTGATALTIQSFSKDSRRPPTADEIQGSILSRYPDASSISSYLDVDSRMAAAIARFTGLKELSVGRLDPNPDVLASLQSLKNLRKLVCAFENVMDREKVAEALPGVSVFVR